MHMADALISPAVGGAMWTATAGLIVYSSSKLKKEADDRKVALMGVLGAFIFAAQMINFSIPGTGSSGHLGGGMILAILLGPHAAFMVMASVLTIQAFFFADGGLLALGCNIFNLGVFPCFIAYPLIFRNIVADNSKTSRRVITASVLASVVSLQLGAFAVVSETLLSSISELPFKTFFWLMQPIHLAIGTVEGAVTAAVIMFVWKNRPEIMERNPIGKININKILFAFLIVTVVTGTTISWFASSNPDGLEWAMMKTSGKEELENKNKIHHTLANIQEKSAILPDYGYKNDESAEAESWPSIDSGTSLSGLIGGFLTLILSVGIGFIFKRRTQLNT